MKRRQLSNEEQRLWEANTRHVKPLSSHPRLNRVEPKVNCKVSYTPAGHQNTLKASVVPAPHPSFQPNRRQLRQIRPHRSVDLHGYTLDQAWGVLESFLRQHVGASDPVLVITGKGSQSHDQTLARQVPRWLHEQPFDSLVKGFHQAKREHGGSGALYVFLKKAKV